ncbi:MAG: Ig-like domain-containing protein [Reichenbachiella sp.]
MKHFTRIVLLCMLLTSAAFSQPIKKSSVMIAMMEDEQTRDAHSVTNIAWGFLPLGNIYEWIDWHDTQVGMIHNEDRVWHARVEFDAGWPVFVDYCEQNGITYADHAALDVGGNTFEYEWFAGQTHGNGGVPLWMSSNSPVFADFLKFQVDMALRTNPAVLMIDAQTSSALACLAQWGNGDFSTHSMTGFTNYIKNTYSAQQISEMGITDINSFNYKTVLNQEHNINTLMQYQNAVNAQLSGQDAMFLYDKFREYQNVAINELVQEITDYAKTISPGIQVGTSSPVMDPYRSTILDDITLYQQELQQIMTQYTYEPELSYKMGEDLGADFVLTADPRDWDEAQRGMVSDEEVKEWIANAYANGANFVAPVDQWTMGSTPYNPSTDMTYIFNWIQDNAKLFDDYSASNGKVALIQSREATRKFVYEINDITYALHDNNIPFDLVVAGDSLYGTVPTFAELDQYEKVLLSQNVYDWWLAVDEQLVADLEQLGDKVIFWAETDDASTLTSVKSALSTSYTVKSNGNSIDDELTVYPRESSIAENSYLVHVINNDYNTGSKAHNIKNNVSLSVDGSVYAKPIVEAYLHQPGVAKQQLQITQNGDQLQIDGMDNVGFWGILELVHTIIPPVSIEVSHAGLGIVNGYSFPFSASVLPTNATNRDITWASSDNNVVTIDQDGLATAVGNGSATITITSNENANIFGTIEIEVADTGSSFVVEAEGYEETGGILDNDDGTLGFMIYDNGPGDGGINYVQTADWGDYTFTLSAADAGIYEMEFFYGTEVDNPGVKIWMDGTDAGTYSMPSNGSWTEYETYTLPTTLNLVEGEHGMRVEGAGASTFEWNADFYTFHRVAWPLGDLPDVPVAGVSLSAPVLDVLVGNTLAFTEAVAPSNASNKNVTWESSNTSVATVDANGLVTGLTEGSTDISVVTEDGNFVATNTISVSVPVDPESVSIDFASLSLHVGDTQILTETVLPANAVDKTVSWSSSNEAVATVDANGVVSAVSIGSADITVTTNTGAKTSAISVSVDPIAVTGVALDQSSITLVLNGSAQLVETVSPANATNQDVSWSSSNPSVVSVDNNGLVSALGTGTATITVSTDDSGFDATSTITVIDQPESVVIELEDYTSTGGVSANNDNSLGFLTYSVGGVDAINWNQTGDYGIYEVEIPANGTYNVVINAGSPSADPAVEISVDGNSLLNESFAASGDWDDFDAIALTTQLDLTSGSHTFRIQSSGSSAWQWNADNVILTLDGVVEHVAVEDVSLNQSSATLETGGSVQLLATVLPANASNKSVTWSSNSANASVDANGNVTANSAGPAEITVTTVEGGFTATSVITINSIVFDVESVSLDQSSATLETGGSVQLSATVLPANATNKSVNWSSNNANASVDANGLVTANSVGSATITVTTVDGSFTDTSVITINSIVYDVESVSVDQTSLSLEINDIVQLNETVLPANATDKSVTWSSTDATVATVSNGVVTAVSEGNATITVTTVDGGYTAMTAVSVLGDDDKDVTLIIEAEDFSSTGGTNGGFEIYDAGNGVTATNWNQTGDWAEYEVVITQAGDYNITYHMATPISGAAVTFYLNSNLVREDNVPNTGGWSAFEPFNAGGTVSLSVGTHAIGLVSTGTNGWEWNMDRFELSTSSSARVAVNKTGSETLPNTALVLYPNPADQYLNIEGLNNGTYQLTVFNVSGAIHIQKQIDFSNQTRLDVSQLEAGHYIIHLVGDETTKSLKFLVK